MNQLPELSALKAAVEKKYGRGVHTSTDFESLSVNIEQSINEFVSASTLKRIWGYVNNRPAPRIATLDILSRYAGARSFEIFRNNLLSNPATESAFFTSRQVETGSLTPGDRITIGWNPNRLVNLEYLGESSFKVLDSQNASLRPGDEFLATQFMMGQPLFLGRILRDGTRTPSYVAGKKDGLTLLEILRKDR